jgi:hypothetical protein
MEGLQQTLSTLACLLRLHKVVRRGHEDCAHAVSTIVGAKVKAGVGAV